MVSGVDRGGPVGREAPAVAVDVGERMQARRTL